MKRFTINMFIVFAFSLNVFFYEETAYAESGEDRCNIKSCLCKVIPEKNLVPKDGSGSIVRFASVYFSEGEYTLSSDQNDSLTEFLSSQHGRKNISIIGYTDGCGSSSHNKALSERRAQEVLRKTKGALLGSRVSVIFGGERSKGHSASSRRVDIIVHTQRSLTTSIERIPADYYLIDASGSMWSGYRRWSDIVAASVRPDSQVFLSITGGCRSGQKMRSVRPYGGTEIWWSYWNIIDLMKPGETLLIVSDFDSQVPLSSKEHRWFVEKVKKAEITVKSVSP